MKNLKEYIISIPKIDIKQMIEITNNYNTTEILEVLDAITEEEKNKYKDNEDNYTIGKKESYKVQKKLWDRYGLLYLNLKYYPFHQDIIERFKETSKSNKKKDSLLSIEQEVKYGFQLLNRDYIEGILKETNPKVERIKNNDLDIEKIIKLVNDKNLLHYILYLLKIFYTKISILSNNDKRIIKLIEEKESSLEIINIIPENLLNSPLVTEINMYIEYRIAREKFINGNSGLIGLAARKHNANYSFEKDDYYQEGYFGLLKAIQKYDIRYGFKFSTYATNWLHEAIMSSSKMKFGTIKIPMHLLGDYYKLKKIEADFIKRNGKEPTIQDFIKLSGLNEKYIMRTFTAMNEMTCVSINAPIRSNEELEIEGTIPDKRVRYDEKIIQKKDTKELLEMIESCLTPKEKYILWNFYGIDGPKKYVEELAKEFGVKHQRISQIVQEAIKKVNRNGKIMKRNPFQ